MEITYMTVEQFCNSFMGDTKGDLPVIAHVTEFEYLGDRSNEYELIGDEYECEFVHHCDLRPCAYLAEKYWRAKVLNWRIYPGAIHILIEPYKEENNG